jgi:hypothetical protein
VPSIANRDSSLIHHLAVLATVIFSSSSKESTRREFVNERRKISYPVSDNPELSETDYWILMTSCGPSQ